MQARLVLLLSALAGVACQPVTVQHTEGPVPVTVRVDDAAYWLEEWQRVTELPEGQVRQILETREKEFSEAPGSRSRLRLALLLAEGPKAVRDQSAAYRLLKEMDHDEASDSASALAALLLQVIGEQSWAGDKISDLRARLKKSEARTEELERQLQELTNIEQSIQQRE